MAENQVRTRSASEISKVYEVGTKDAIKSIAEFTDEKVAGQASQDELEYLDQLAKEAEERAAIYDMQGGIIESIEAAYHGGIYIAGNEPNQHSFVCGADSSYSEEDVRNAANDLIEKFQKMGFDSTVQESRESGELIIDVAPNVPVDFQGKDLLDMQPEELQDAQFAAKLERSSVPSSKPTEVSARAMLDRSLQRI